MIIFLDVKELKNFILKVQYNSLEMLDVLFKSNKAHLKMFGVAVTILKNSLHMIAECNIQKIDCRIKSNSMLNCYFLQSLYDIYEAVLKYSKM